MKAYARDGREILVGHKYLFAETRGDIVRVVTAIVDEKSVRIADGWSSSRWACNALYEVF